MEQDIHRLVERLHAARTMTVVAMTGGGSQVISWLLGVPGASRTVLEVMVPYGPASLVEFLGHEPDQSASAQTAKEMAREAYRRAVRLRESDVPVVGLGCTAAIATDRPKAGEHRCHVATWSHDAVTWSDVGLVKELRDRVGEDTIVSRLALRALAEASGVDCDLSLGLEARETMETHSARYRDPIEALVSGHVRAVTVHADGTPAADEPVHGGLLSGSFNPLHEGHERLAAVASEMLNTPVTFELSVTNVDKPPLPEPETRERVAQFSGRHRVVVTRALAFYQKANLFPGCTFVIGWDTAVRLVDPEYYGGNGSEMVAALVELRRLGCDFLVAGRLEGGVFRTLGDVSVPAAFESMFRPVPESVFRYDLSSTELRMTPRRG